MNTENAVPPKPSFGSRLWLAFKRFFIFLFRLLLILLVVAAVGAAIYYGAPVLIDEYILKDVHTNTHKIQEISAEFEDSSEIFSQRLVDIQARLETLEIQNDTDKQTINDLGAQLKVAESALQEQATSLENLDPLQSMLEEYGVKLSSLEEQVSAYETDLDELQKSIMALGLSLEVYGTQIEGNKAEIETLNAQIEARDPVGYLRQELELLKVMELITRARVSIGQENIGLAKDDLAAAQDLLAGLHAEVPASQAEYLSEISQRLGLASENLTGNPDLAYEDMEVAWQLLLQGLPDESELTPTPTPGEGGEVEPTPTPTPSP